MRNHSLNPKEIINILKQKELRRHLNKEHILENFSIVTEAKNSGSENLYYKEEINAKEMTDVINNLLQYL